MCSYRKIPMCFKHGYAQTICTVEDVNLGHHHPRSRAVMSSSKFTLCMFFTQCQLLVQLCMHYHSICIIIKTSYITHLHLQPYYLIHIACQYFVYVFLLKTNLGLCRYKIQTIVAKIRGVYLLCSSGMLLHLSLLLPSVCIQPQHVCSNCSHLQQ